jgi:hypothetical protein
VGIKRKQHSTEFKARVAMTALSGEKTLAELSAEFGVHPTMISNWKQERVKHAGELFARGSKAPAVEDADSANGRGCGMPAGCRLGFLLGFARKARQSPVAVKCYRFAAGTAAPAALLGLSALIVASLAHRGVFDLLSTAGTYCHSTIQTQDEKLDPGPALIHTNAMCNPTGFNVVAGRKYRIRLKVGDDWFDKGTHTDVGGFAADSFRHYWASPLKRRWRENWFQPIARIGELGNYEHVLQASAPLPVVNLSQCTPRTAERQSLWDAIKDIPQPASKEFRQQLACEMNAGIQRSKILLSDLTADATGELFIYVNDAVLMWLGQTDIFYQNNSGTAWVWF